MIYQMPIAGRGCLFAASSAETEEQAQQELQNWAGSQGYRFAKAERTFTVYAAEQTPRQWVLLERATSRASEINRPSSTGR